MNDPDLLALMSVVILQQQRIYDVLLTILGHENAEAAYNLIKVHEELDNIGPVPYKVDE